MSGCRDVGMAGRQEGLLAMEDGRVGASGVGGPAHLAAGEIDRDRFVERGMGFGGEARVGEEGEPQLARGPFEDVELRTEREPGEAVAGGGGGVRRGQWIADRLAAN